MFALSQRHIFATVAGWLIAASSISLVAQPPASPPEMLNDAELTCVTFLDADAGWAVGDRGVIWATVDGGRHWQRQDSKTACRLEHVFFFNHELGWAVGEWHQPYSHRSVGVLLKTLNGGNTWQVVSGHNLPGLRSIKFFDANRGVAVGDSSPLYPSGIFTTKDGGRSWASMPGQTESWLTADFSTGSVGAMITSRGQVATTNLLELQPAGMPALQGRLPAALRLQPQGTSWLCGEGGLLLYSPDRGASWSTPVHALPEEAAKFDFTALAVHQSHVWLAGNPGSLLFHSPDAGRTWYTQHTDQTLPLRSLFFLDENRGWAVGAFGTILATRDGGETWRMQRQGGTRAALLALVSQPERLPLEMLVQTAGNEGFLTAVEVLTTDANATSSGSSLAQRTLQAGAGVGAAATHTAWQYPLARDDDYKSLDRLRTTWQESHAGQSVEHLEEYLVQRIRMWRPEVIMTEDASPRGEDPLAHLVNQLVISAAAKAGEANVYPQQRTQLGLGPWKVKKVFAARAAGQTGTINLTATQLAPRLGSSLLELADSARGQWHDRCVLGPAKCGYELLVDHLPQGQGRRDFFSGIPLAPGGDARRALSAPTNVDMQTLAHQIQKQQSLRQLLERSVKEPARGEGLLAQLNEHIRGLSPAIATRSLYFLGQRYEESGELKLASDTMQQLAERNADEPLADFARLWLLQHESSAEIAWLSDRKLHPRRDNKAQPAVAVEPSLGEIATDAVVPVSATSSENEARFARTLALGKQIEKNRPSLYSEPAVRFAIAHAAKQQKTGDQAVNLLQALANARQETWSPCAAAELWLMQEKDNCPKKALPCVRAASKPLLDGRLDDELWQSAQAAALKPTRATPTTADSIVALSYDDEFLFIAVSCRRQAGFEYATETKVRTRDADLSAHDRVEILLDTDRDYATYYRLVIDHRGWTNDACGSDSTWNPAWFVASGGDDNFWTAEAAIAWSELVAESPSDKSTFALGVQRIIHGEPLQSWTRPATRSIQPEGFGLLRFK